MRKTRRRCVVLACIMTWFGDFAWMKKFVFFFAWKDASFGFRNMIWQWMSTFAVSGNYCSLDCCFIADDENCCREMLVGCTAELQKPWFLPYTYNSAQIFVNFIHGSPRTSRKQKQEYILVMLVLIFSNEPQCWWSSGANILKVEVLPHDATTRIARKIIWSLTFPLLQEMRGKYDPVLALFGTLKRINCVSPKFEGISKIQNKLSTMLGLVRRH